MVGPRTTSCTPRVPRTCPPMSALCLCPSKPWTCSGSPVPSPRARSGCKYPVGTGSTRLVAHLVRGQLPWEQWGFISSSLPKPPLATQAGVGAMGPPGTHVPLCSSPSTYAPVKPFLRVDKEKVRGAHPCHCHEHLSGHGSCHLIIPRVSSAPPRGAGAKGSMAGAPVLTPVCPSRCRSTILPSSSTSTTAGQNTTGATPPRACWCSSLPSMSVMRWVMSLSAPGWRGVGLLGS